MNYSLIFLVFAVSGNHFCVKAQNTSQNQKRLLSSLYNTTSAWGSFFGEFPRLWTSINTALTSGAPGDLNKYANQAQSLMRTGFGDKNAEINDATPGLLFYQRAARRALLDLGLPGTIVSASISSTPNVITYELDTPFPLFVNQTGSLVGPIDGDATWYLGPHICLTRTSALNQRPDATRNGTYCISSRDESRMNVVCWLPTLANDGSAISGTKYTTIYRCCDGYSLAALPTQVPLNPFPSLMELVTLADRVNPPDNRVCQSIN